MYHYGDVLQPWLTTADHIASRPMATSFNLVLNSDGEQPPNKGTSDSGCQAGAYDVDVSEASRFPSQPSPASRSGRTSRRVHSGWETDQNRHCGNVALRHARIKTAGRRSNTQPRLCHHDEEMHQRGEVTALGRRKGGPGYLGLGRGGRGSCPNAAAATTDSGKSRRS